MEGMYQNNLYPQQQQQQQQQTSSYMIPPNHSSDHTYSHYGSYHRTSAFSDARSYQPTSSAPPSSTSYHSAGLNTSDNYPSDFHPPTQYSPSSSLAWPSSNSHLSWNTSSPPSASSSRHNSYSSSNGYPSLIHGPPMQRAKLTTTVWEDEGTVCYQVDAKGVCVARRQDNDMINGTKLLNVVGMSRGKRDGILKNEKGRVVVKVGAMHLKGVWITFTRAKDLATKFKIVDILYPLFVEDPSVFLTTPHAATNLPVMSPPNTLTPRAYQSTNSFGSFSMSSWEKQSLPTLPPPPPPPPAHDQMLIRSQANESGSCSPVPGTLLPSHQENDMYLLSHHTTRPSYHSNAYALYDPPPSGTSQTPFPYTQRKAEKEQRRSSIDFPSSPPPESTSMKYTALDTSWQETRQLHEKISSPHKKSSPLGM
ncbi:uncharacterized protein B0P05DRAFT_560377 [Gilbertella persicaria]|uniref:uncharacterized protein n=1 Tax=Gilbertella persicaria TaxID=101096 RepID=UPI00221E3DFC|nr:uncharacterized protein B0P05DRAFT_560377 [Gilbertella persicaria]KAI8056304.1 hypothetical protein B0P05DRAFT_560377 [Gilbertella persicaria]